MVHATILLAGLAGLASIVSAHPGHDVKAEAAERAAFLKNSPIQARGLSQCETKLKARGHESSAVARRQRVVENLRRKRGVGSHAPLIKARDLDTALNTTHHSGLQDVTPSIDPNVLFGYNPTCILGPDVTQGPYYVTGEMIRSDITEDQEGVPLFLDIQLVDSNSCEPVPEIYMDIWHCNSTGVYSGVSASGNGNSDDTSNLNNTFLRGLQKTNRDGVAQFETLFPGHYTGRATHIHVLSHPANETKVFSNNTVSGLYTSHSNWVGQIFFDDDLISTVEKTEPYSSNTQELTTNSEDSILAEEAESIDPFAEYVFLGDRPEDGIFAWISAAIDITGDTSVTPAAYYTKDGGATNPNSGMGMGGGPPPGDAPGGASPSGSSSASASSSSASA